jgi:hypothetical protein
MGQYNAADNNYAAKPAAYPQGERMTFSQTDFARLNMGGGMPYQGATNTNQPAYDMDYKPSSYASPPPQPYNMPDYSSGIDTGSMFIPQSKYLQEEFKNNYGKDFGSGYAPKPQPKSMQMDPSYQNMNMPQPQKYEPKPEPTK